LNQDSSSHWFAASCFFLNGKVLRKTKSRRWTQIDADAKLEFKYPLYRRSSAAFSFFRERIPLISCLFLAFLSPIRV